MDGAYASNITSTRKMSQDTRRSCMMMVSVETARDHCGNGVAVPVSTVGADSCLRKDRREVGALVVLGMAAALIEENTHRKREKLTKSNLPTLCG